MSSKVKIAWGIIVKPDDREAELLDRLLSGKQLPKEKNIDFREVGGLAKNVDKLFITITGKNKKCESVARKHKAVISFYDWDKNFANARNFNFSQIPHEYEYVGWADSDDVIKNPQMIRDIVQTAKKEAIDAIVLSYNYDFDDEGKCIVEQRRERIMRNDGSIKWVGSVHEVVIPERQWMYMENKDIQLFHLTDAPRIEIAKHRNTEIAQKALAIDRNDPRNYWNLANALLMEGKHTEALPVYLDFLEWSQSEEERFLGWHRLSGIFKGMGDYNKAITTELEALALRPWYPDAYFALGELYLKVGKLQHAKEILEMGFAKKTPEGTAIVWNPRDYDYNPRMQLVSVCMQLKKPREALSHLNKCLEIYPKSKNIKNLIKKLAPEIKKFDIAEEVFKKAKKLKSKEKIKELLDSVPKSMKYYPAIVNLRNTHFVKQESSGKDVVIYCGFTNHIWDPEIAATKGVGGSEEAVIQLSKRFVKAGYNVSVYANIGHNERVFDGVKYLPFMAWNYRDKQDVTILWRHPKAVDYNINSNIILVDMHDVVPIGEFTKERISKITKVMFKSNVHYHYYPQIPTNKIVVVPHGLDIEEFDKLRSNIKRNPYRILNTSSADRGLRTCMRVIRRVFEKLPTKLKSKLKFSWYYGFDVWDYEFASDEEMMNWKNEAVKEMNELKKLGVMTEDSGGRISQAEVTKKYLESGMLLYPSNFFEIGFISGIKAMLGGCVPLTTDIFAQGEFIKEGIKIHSEVGYNDWVIDLKKDLDYGVEDMEEVANKVVDYITSIDKWDKKRYNIIESARQFNWDKTAEGWINVFKELGNK